MNNQPIALKNILPLFSYLFHPLFISVYAVLGFFYFGNHYYRYPEVYMIIIQIIILTIFVPMTFYYLLLSMKKVDSVMLTQTSQRKMPLLIHALLLMVLLQKSITVDYFPELHYFFLGSLISTGLALALVFVGYKVSLHMIGIMALTVFIIGTSLHFHTRLIAIIVPLLICNGLVASSRLAMDAHTEKELLLGSFIGLAPQIGLLYFWL
jgi:hypothetical protein